MSERARGRARGRARTTEEQVRRPGEQTQYEEQTAAGSSSSSSHAPFAGGAPTTVAGSGKASYRGGVREPRPGAGDAPRRPADDANRRPADVAPLRLGTGDASNVKRRRQDFSYDEPALKPAHTTEKRGTVGQQIPLKTNFFKLESVADWKLYQYHVDFNPPLDSKKLRIALLYTHSELLGATKVFDGMILFLPKKLPNVETEVFSQTRAGENIRITIKLTNELPPTSPQCLHAYNVIFRKVLQMMEMQEIGRNYYNMKQVKEIPEHHLRVAPGFSTSILQYENQSLLCADVSHKVFRTDTVLDMMYEMHSRGNPTFHEDCLKLLVGSTVLTRYNNKTYRVDDIEWSARPTDTFKLRKGDNITYCEYYRRSYDIILEDMEQPMLVSRPSKKDIKMGRTEHIFLLPELCILTGLSDEMRKDHRVMKDVAVYTRLGPEARCRDLSDFIRQINAKKDIQQYMGGWGLKFSSTLLLLNGRILPKEKITLCNDAECMFNPNEPDWTKDLRGKQFLTSVNMNSWVLLYFHKNAGSAQDLCQALSRVGPPMGMRIDRPNICELRDDRTESYIRGIRQTVGPRTQLVLALLPNNRKDRYDAIKKECCVNLPVPSQCVLVKNMFKNLMSVATKIAIQLNCKLGGEIWKCEIPLNKLMIIGLDTYHDSSKKGQSVGGVVASINKNCTRFYSRTTFQLSAQELNNGLQVCVTDAIKKYQAENRVHPDKIILYRDGVGDGQLPAVYEHEVSQLTTTIQEAAGLDNNIKLAVVVVKKRINSRFFARGGRGDHANPVPGTVVDTEVTKPQWFDFFLISQSVRQGTVSPTHYNVIWDTTGMKPDHHQRLAYKMCHMYYNWPGTIRVPAPCQYAHKLAFLVGQSIHREPALDLSDRLYYL